MTQRTVSWLMRATRRSPYRGLVKTDARIRHRAAGVNLKRLVAKGLDNLAGQRVLPATG
jgi:hypothetical protein